MKIIKPSVEILTPIDGDTILKHIEQCGRVCYKSEDKITQDSCRQFVSNILKRGHEAVLEHFNITVKFICDRGVTHEIVRHRVASYCQESTRYCLYAKGAFDHEITVILPCYLTEGTTGYDIWKEGCMASEIAYMKMIDNGNTAQEARAVLPNSLKTELVMTANLREWRHFFKLRTSSAAHPQMREVATMLLNELKSKISIIFDNINV